METPLASPTSEIPPWERVELPVFQVDGQRYGGSSTPTGNNLWGNWKGLAGSVRDPNRRPSSPPNRRPSSPPDRRPSSPLSQTARHYGSGSTGHEVSSHPSPPNIITPCLDNIPAIIPTIVDFDHSPYPTPIPDFARRPSGELTGSNGHLDRLRKGSVISTPISELGPITPSASSTHLAGPQEPSDLHARRDSVMTSESRRSSGTPSHSERELLPVPPRIPHRDVENQHEERDEDWDLMRVLHQTAPPKSANDRFGPAEGETVELVEESMASYLNRKTALLMLWFPLGVSGPQCNEDHS